MNTYRIDEPDENAYDVQCSECKHELSHCTCEPKEDEMDKVDSFCADYDRVKNANNVSAFGLMDVATLLALCVRRSEIDRPLNRITLDSLDAWREAAGCFLSADNITQSERVRARILAVEFLSACLREA